MSPRSSRAVPALGSGFHFNFEPRSFFITDSERAGHVHGDVSTASFDASVSFPPSKVVPQRVGQADIHAPKASSSELSFEEVYDLHFDFVWRNLRRLGVSEAGIDDAVQEVFLVIHRRLSELRESDGVRKWIFAIVFRVACETRRALRRKLPDSQAESIEVDSIADERGGCPHECAEQRETAQRLHRLLCALDDDKRAVFVLAELEEMTAPEIASALSLNLNTVYARLRAARREFEQAVLREQARDAWRLR